MSCLTTLRDIYTISTTPTNLVLALVSTNVKMMLLLAPSSYYSGQSLSNCSLL